MSTIARPPGHDLRKVHRRAKDRQTSVCLEGAPTIPADCDTSLRFKGTLTDEQELRCQEAIVAAKEELKRRYFEHKRDVVQEEVGDGDDD